jgi:hypothetical protein
MDKKVYLDAIREQYRRAKIEIPHAWDKREIISFSMLSSQLWAEAWNDFVNETKK